MSEEINNTETPVVSAPEEAAPAAPIAAASPTTPATSSYDRPRRPQGQREGGDQYQRMPRFRKKVCRFCSDKNLVIDYKDAKTLERYITDRGKILPRRVTGTCSKHQRFVARAIKRARIVAIVPFLEK
jgi:small subunit ribosomal protein S18